jgi:type IV pilus assembly protein PilX
MCTTFHSLNLVNSANNHKLHIRHAQLRAQRGVALLMVLMVTMVIVALSVSLASSVLNDHRMSRNSADLAIARQAAESALRDAEYDIMCQRWDSVSKSFMFHSNITGDANSGATPSPRSYCNTKPESGKQIWTASLTNVCDKGMVLIPTSTNGSVPVSINYNDVNCFVEYGRVTEQAELNLLGVSATQPNKPRYSIELFTDPQSTGPTIPTFRITARGYGRNSSSTVDLQSIYRPFAN